MQRLFIAVWPTEDMVEELKALPRKPRPGIKWVEPHNWHVTLRFLGDADPVEVTDRLTPLRVDETRIRYGPGVDVLNERVVVVPVHGLDDLAAGVAGATAGLGTEAPRKRFVGHLTLARLGKRPPRLNVVGTPVAGVQRVQEIALIASTLHPEGVRYEVLEAFPV